MTTRPAAADSRAMMKVIVPMLVAAALGCASDVDLPLDLERGGEGDGQSPSSTPPLGEVAWARTDFGGQGSIHDVAWASGGGLLATAAMAGPDGVGGPAIVTLARYRADGTLEWESGVGSGIALAELSPTADGGAVVSAVSEDWLPGGPERPAGLDFFDGSGELTASWRGDDVGGGDTLYAVQLVQSLSDGGAFWGGTALSDDLTVETQMVGIVDADGVLRWVAAVPPDDVGDAIGPMEAALAPDGGIFVLASHGSAGSGESAAFVTRYAADGSEVWRTPFTGDGDGNGIAVSPSGNVVVSGNYGPSLAVGDLRLEGDRYEHQHFVAELDPAGQPLRLHRLELPEAIDSEDIGALAISMTMVGDELVVGGYYYTRSSAAPQRHGYYAAAHRLDGELASELIFATEMEPPSHPGAGFIAADATPEGRLVVGGSFAGKADFGDGEIDTGLDEYGFALSRPLILVIDPVDEVD